MISKDAEFLVKINMKNYEDQFTEIHFGFKRDPVYDYDERGRMIIGDLLLNFFSKGENKHDSRSRILQQVSLPLVDISESISYLEKSIQEVLTLKIGDTSKNLIPLISVSKMPQDLGIFWTFTKENNYYFIQFDIKSYETILIKIKNVDFFNSIKEFMGHFLDLVKEINCEPNFKVKLTHKILKFLESIP